MSLVVKTLVILRGKFEEKLQEDKLIHEYLTQLFVNPCQIVYGKDHTSEEHQGCIDFFSMGDSFNKAQKEFLYKWNIGSSRSQENVVKHVVNRMRNEVPDFTDMSIPFLNSNYDQL